MAKPQRLFAVVMAPTRELAVQIGEQFNALGAGIGAQCAVVVGGVDMIAQQVILAKKPHIVIATPGRLIDHLENTKVRRSSLAAPPPAHATLTQPHQSTHTHTHTRTGLPPEEYQVLGAG